MIGALSDAVRRHQLSPGQRLTIARLIRAAIVPKGKPGKKLDKKVDAALLDYRAGLRGLKLYRAHIPRHGKLSRWRRQHEERRLMNDIHKRIARERGFTKTA